MRPRRKRFGRSSTTPATLKSCIPGCEQLDKTSDTEFQAIATVKIGPVKAKFKGKVTLSDLDPPHGYKISGQGDGGVAGFAKGGATVKLTPKDGGTLLAYDVEAQIGGKLAQLGQRLVNGAAKKVADDFFASFASRGESEKRIIRPLMATRACTHKSGLVGGWPMSAYRQKRTLRRRSRKVR